MCRLLGAAGLSLGLTLVLNPPPQLKELRTSTLNSSNPGYHRPFRD